MRWLRAAIAVASVLLVASPAMAEKPEPVKNEKFGVEIQPPEKWEVAQGSEKAVATFKHTGSQSQIEVVATKLMTKDVSDVFFETFHKTLKESDFKKVSQEEATIAGFEGKRTDYEFEHSGVKLHVPVFQFLKNDTAWLVVGYIQKDVKKEYLDEFKTVVKNIEFTGGDGGGDKKKKKGSGE